MRLGTRRAELRYVIVLVVIAACDRGSDGDGSVAPEPASSTIPVAAPDARGPDYSWPASGEAPPPAPDHHDPLSPELAPPESPHAPPSASSGARDAGTAL
jgi:hypothetical protein